MQAISSVQAGAAGAAAMPQNSVTMTSTAASSSGPLGSSSSSTTSIAAAGMGSTGESTQIASSSAQRSPLADLITAFVISLLTKGNDDSENESASDMLLAGLAAMSLSNSQSYSYSSISISNQGGSAPLGSVAEAYSGGGMAEQAGASLDAVA